MTPQDYALDKSHWPDGPWQQEPDRADWRHDGFACLALRDAVGGHWCGYVGIPPEHPWHGKNYDVLDVQVHGGITSAHACDNEDLWWLGFDCAHAWDRRPADTACADIFAETGISYLEFPPASYKTLEYVQAEVNRLAWQAALVVA